MTSGWTGGQYSVYRGLLAIMIVCVLEERLVAADASLFDALVMLGAVLLCLALALGWRDRMAALLLWLFGLGRAAYVDGAPLVWPNTDVIMGSVLLLLHAATPRGPYGAWAARERPDPAGDWQMPRWIPHCAWALLALAYLASDLALIVGASLSTDLGGFSRPAFRVEAVGIRQWVAIGLFFDLAFAIAVFRVRWRASAWIALSLWRVAGFFAFGPAIADAHLWLLHLLAADPAWLVGRSNWTALPAPPDVRAHAASAHLPARLFYDGDCGLCHRSVRFILSEESGSPSDLRLRFAPIGSEAFGDMIARDANRDPQQLPDSIVLELEDGRILTRSAAALEIANRLGGLWRVIAATLALGGLMPASGLDLAYDGIAGVRKRIFTRPKDSCPILPADLRARFDL